MKRVLICLLLMLIFSATVAAEWKDLGETYMANRNFHVFERRRGDAWEKVLVPHSVALGGTLAIKTMYLSNKVVLFFHYQLAGCGANYIKILEISGNVSQQGLKQLDVDEITNQMLLLGFMENQKETILEYYFQGQESTLLLNNLNGVEINLIPFEDKSAFFLSGEINQ